ncbi:hypothetical protein AVEN_233638-1 [Araneus ventricosus]|uniref:PH domain-containing protein n=1 Tax=Araneus ventricosus TaxID=182803 RepID=A0A4Y2KQ79_ARAVE|nr:hypothetical protein AVEN_233638-1 [Araneus ventricosus]
MGESVDVVYGHHTRGRTLFKYTGQSREEHSRWLLAIESIHVPLPSYDKRYCACHLRCNSPNDTHEQKSSSWFLQLVRAATHSRQTCSRKKGNLYRSEKIRGEENASGRRMEGSRRRRDFQELVVFKAGGRANQG